MILDDISPNIIWRIHNDVYLDSHSLSILVAHCRKLSQLSSSTEDWVKSDYGRILRWGTTNSLVEARRLWSAYTDLVDMEAPTVREAVVEAMLVTKKQRWIYSHSSARSACPLHEQAKDVYREAYDHYWTTGTTHTGDCSADLAINPAFYHSRYGPGFALHPCSDPLTPFHTPSLFGNNHINAVTIADLFSAAQQEFVDWCASFRSAASDLGRVTVRFLHGDALRVARSLDSFSASGDPDSRLPIAQWRSRIMILSVEEYVDVRAPTTFDVIDTSTLRDDIGMFNLFSVATPLLSARTPASGTLYTESLLRWPPRGKKRDMPGYDKSDYHEFSFWFNLSRVEFYSGFTSGYHVGEKIDVALEQKEPDGTCTDFEVTVTRRLQPAVWKRPTSGDAFVKSQPMLRFQDPNHLAELLFQVYYRMIGDLDALHYLRLQIDSWRYGHVIDQSRFHTAESFAIFLKCIRDRFYADADASEWQHLMDLFQERIFDEKFLSTGDLIKNCHSIADIETQLQYHGLSTLDAVLDPPRPPESRFSSWEVIPVIVRIYMTMPRHEDLWGRDRVRTPGSGGLEELLTHVGTSPLYASVCVGRKNQLFQSLDFAFGRLVNVGTPSAPRVEIEEDPEGFRGTSNLIVSFLVTTLTLTELRESSPDEPMLVTLSFNAAAGKSTYFPRRSPNTDPPGALILEQFSAELGDEERVFVVPEEGPTTRRFGQPCEWLSPSPDPPSPAPTSIGTPMDVVVNVCVEEGANGTKRARTPGLISGIVISDASVRAMLHDTTRKPPVVTQVSPCVLRVDLGDSITQDVIYPLPVNGEQYELECNDSDEAFIEVRTVFFVRLPCCTKMTNDVC